MGTGVASGFWNAVASSADGNRLVAAVYSGAIYVSADSGASWMPTTAPTGNWMAVASSADGSKLIALQGGGLFIPGPGYGGPVYTSTDSGATWTSNNVPDAFAVASSADGNKLVAVLSGGGIWTSQSTPTPVLNISQSGTNLLLSWLVPSMDFVLQQNPDFTTANWTSVPTTPTLNFSNLQYEVTVPLLRDHRFYRLKH